jgi:hypothetical protein
LFEGVFDSDSGSYSKCVKLFSCVTRLQAAAGMDTMAAAVIPSVFGELKYGVQVLLDLINLSRRMDEVLF